MPVIAVASKKGGSGKTTISTNLADALDLAEDLATKQARALATVQALHSDGMISDAAAAALNKALEVEE